MIKTLFINGLNLIAKTAPSLVGLYSFDGQRVRSTVNTISA